MTTNRINQVNPEIFREYDIRGLVEPDLTDDLARLVGKGLGTCVRRARGQRIALGRDCRMSSPRLRDALLDGLLSTGCDVLDLGVVPTPLTYFAANTLAVDGLAMITGSHNPADYNGFKLGVGHTTFWGEEIQRLRALIESGDFEQGRGQVKTWDITTPYLDFIRQEIGALKRAFKVVVDAGNGVGGLVALPMLRALGCEVIELFCEPDGRFPNHHPDPTVEKNLGALIAAVRAHGADLGIAYDGDADRVGVVDEQGTILWGDELTLLFARALLERCPGATIVGEVKCSMRFYDGIAARGGRAVMCKAGHSIIKARMKAEGALLAGEMSGHIFWKDRYFGFDDALYSTARLLELLDEKRTPLSLLLADLPKTAATPEIRRDAITESRKFEIVRRAVAHFKAEGRPVDETDGARITFENGWGLVRASNTQPILVLRFEAETPEALTRIQGNVEAALAHIEAQLPLP
ncbi:MAG: phosphomannomutase/phosphoglucomutase [Myxococcales bacterium]|jgi:phosphomannomutase/phosphoglucomutase|nr:phosphomannomutase/phosphoglucomutase [Myxococcales bacterium]